MEVGMNYNLNSMNSVDNFNLLNANTFGAINAPQKMGHSLVYNNLNSLNSTCSSLDASPTMFITGFKSGSQNLTYGLNNPGFEESKNTYDFLRKCNIPIYEEVLSFKIKETDCEINILPSPVSSSPQLQYNQVISTNLRKRMATEVCEKEHEMYSLNSQKVLSTAQSFSNQNSSAENSHPLGELGINRRLGNVKDNNANELNFGYFDVNADFMNYQAAYVPTQSSATYKPVVIAEGANTVLPAGYIQVQKEKESSRKTKVVTKCEHTDRKHYAKGLCSTCYHKGGRTKNAWNCEHRNKLHYAKGCCQECYITFHSKRGQNKLRKMMDDESKSLTELLQGDDFESFSPSDLL